jgi:sugar phosphate isomerase/epimerase
MKLGLINSAWLGTSVDVVRGIQLTKEIGFDTIDIFADPLELTPQQRREIQDTCVACKLPVVSVVCCALGIADFNKSVREFHVHRAERYLEFASELRAKNIVLVLGEYLWNKEVIKPSDQWNWAVEHVRELSAFAAGLGIEVAIELEPFALSLVNNISKMRSFLEQVNHPNAMANVDISHLALARNAAPEIAALKGKIAHVHLSDCDGTKHGDLPPGRGVVEFPPYLKMLDECGFDGSISVELEYAPDPSAIIDWVRDAYASTDRLMSSLGIRS